MRSSNSLPPRLRRPPKSISDLGFDFTRYFNPAGHSRKNSTNPVYASESRKCSAVALPDSNSEKQLSEQPKRTESPEKSIHSTDSEKLFYPFLDDSLTGPGVEDAGHTFPLFVSDKEFDDDMHMPGADDDVRYRPRWRDHFSKDNFVSTIGMFLMLGGLVFVFIVLPVLSYTGTWLLDYPYVTPLDQMPGYGKQPPPQSWAWVNDRKYPLLQNIRSGLIDPDTPQSALTAPGVNGENLVLVFSDEFNDQNRTFYPGDDPFFYAFDGWYGATKDLDYYDPDAVTTYNGVLELRLDRFVNHGLQFRSGMLHSWNQLCLKGGRFEVSVSLPGPGGFQGLWPGVWTMGNLGRPGYLATTDGMWPYTYDSCDAGITPNQSDHGGLSNLPGQRLPSCTCGGQDHPTPGNGRGAPEIDILEASADQVSQVGLVTQSYQVAPFDVWYMPDRQYTEFPDYNLSYPNSYVGGPYQQALSSDTMINNSWYDGRFYQKYAFEYTPGGGEDGQITWFAANDVTWHLDGRAIGQNGNVGPRLISEEPMSLVMNLGLSTSWSNLDWANLRFPTVMRIDYVRWYQEKGQEMVTCDPPGYETTEYIKKHPEAYNNPNYTSWSAAGYQRPLNILMDGC
ncbi:glycoside hydrolase family 16 protein [Viridothelium virens]|uniref:Glycoside hydrolase family 16 protein n=1 Tax=Viridothelium virens TaxID=1048519 RepID=A0A6A6H695_VIRVR|nr:glycoside hydrolase family 16 protein [Viridothelium virens]